MGDNLAFLMVNFWWAIIGTDLAYLIWKVQERIVIDYTPIYAHLSAEFYMKFGTLEL